MSEEFETRARHAADAVKAGVENHAGHGSHGSHGSHEGDGNDDREHGSISVSAFAHYAEEHKQHQHRRAAHIRNTAIGAVSALVLIATGMFGTTQLAHRSHDKHSGNTETLGTFELAGDLKPFSACDDALEYFKEHAPNYFIERMEPRSIPLAEDSLATTEQAPLSGARDGMASQNPATTMPHTASSESQTQDMQYSTTNVQERGVDEPDVMKTDGKRVFAIAHGIVYGIVITNGTPVRTSIFDIHNAQSLLLSGDRLLVLSTTSESAQPTPFRTGILPMPDGMYQSAYQGEKTILTAFDVSDNGHPKKLQSIELDGTLLDARMTGTTVRVATQWTPDVNTPSPKYENGKLTEASKQALRDTIANSRLADWVPQQRVVRADGSQVSSNDLVACDQLARPATFSGLHTVGVTSFDMRGDIAATSSVGVVAGGERVYANEKSFYVTSSPWNAGSFATASNTTHIHKFAVASNDTSGLAMSYRGSGAVKGALLNSYAMSERKDALRVATTLSGSTGWIRRSATNEGVITTLAERNGKLEQVGFLDGLGRNDAESIRAVRFIDDKAYVVTFRQTDPLFVIDLSDVATPKVVGELKIPGFSGYLHPIGKNQLLGVGMGPREELDATQGNLAPGTQQGAQQSSTTTTTPGTPGVAPNATLDIAPSVVRPTNVNLVQFRLFDISDPRAPKLVDTRTYGAGSAGAIFDPKAFLYWEPRNLVIAPAQYFQLDKKAGASEMPGSANSGSANTGIAPTESFNGLLLLTPGQSELRETGRISYIFGNNNTHAMYANVSRTMVIGDNVYMLSDIGLQANSLDTHKIIGQADLK